MNLVCFFFFFSRRRRHTRLSCDWSSDVCSSDLEASRPAGLDRRARALHALELQHQRSEERRVGEKGRSRWSPYHLKKKKTTNQYVETCTKEVNRVGKATTRLTSG